MTKHPTYKVLVQDGEHVRTVLAQGETKQKAINFAQRLMFRKFGIDRADFHTNKISVELAESGFNYNNIRKD